MVRKMAMMMIMMIALCCKFRLQESQLFFVSLYFCNFHGNCFLFCMVFYFFGHHLAFYFVSNFLIAVVSWTTVSEKHDIYVVDLGLTPKACNDLVTTTEQACRGRYAAYTYAKQTLGCREYPLLAQAALGPVHSMVGAIMEKFDGMGPDAKEKAKKLQKKENASNTANSATTTSPMLKVYQQKLQLDDREPHIVKYDITRKERQKLDMHTDKSE